MRMRRVIDAWVRARMSLSITRTRIHHGRDPRRRAAPPRPRARPHAAQVAEICVFIDFPHDEEINCTEMSLSFEMSRMCGAGLAVMYIQ